MQFVMQIKFRILWRVCHSLAACQRHTPSLLAAVIGLSNNDVISLRSWRCVRCVGWKPRYGLFLWPELMYGWPAVICGV